MRIGGGMFEWIKAALDRLERKELPEENLKPSAVLVPLFLKDDVTHLLMSRRTDRVLWHKRQISYPGGVRDPQDRDATSTALREAWEEVGLDPQDVTVLGLLGDIETVTGFLVTPVVGCIPYPYPFRLSSMEVQELLEVPWSVFSERKGHRREMAEHGGRTFEVDFYQHGEDTIWGATARITRQLVELIEPSAKISVGTK
jgi:8-oxo-dGTP pyrophosphatase MutT (NUDIX family)